MALSGFAGSLLDPVQEFRFAGRGGVKTPGAPVERTPGAGKATRGCLNRFPWAGHR